MSLTTKIQRILLLPLSGLGDAVCFLPSVRAIRKRFPEAEIVVVSTSAGCPILESAELRLDVIAYDRGRRGSFVDALKMVRSLRRRKFDIVLSRGLLHSYRIPLLALLSGSKQRVGASSERLAFVYNRKILIPDDVHTTERYRRLTAAIGIPDDGTLAFPRILPSDRHKESAMRIWKKCGIRNGNRVIGFASGSDITVRGKWNPALKCWRVEGYAEVARWLMQERNTRVVMFGSEKESGAAEQIMSLAGVPIANLCGETSIGDLQWLIGKCDVVLSNDSGIAHLTAALGTRVLALFGPTDPATWGPVGDVHRVLVGKAHCGPCYPNPTCDRNGCIAMEAIDPHAVIEILDMMLNRKGPMQS